MRLGLYLSLVTLLAALCGLLVPLDGTFARTGGTSTFASSFVQSPVWLHGECFATHFEKWEYVNPTFAPKDPRYAVPIPPEFNKSRTFMLSSKRESPALGHTVWWKRVDRQSLRVWTNGAMEGFESDWNVRGNNVRGKFWYSHDVSPRRKAVLVGVKVRCPSTTQGVILAYVWSDPP